MIKTYPKGWLLVLTVGLGTLLNPLNSSMISVALTRIQNDFSLTFAEVSWLITIFYLASAVGQPVMGKLSDMFGSKRLFLSGLLLVSISCALAPFASNYGFLLFCRTLQAIGSSTLFPSGMSMIRSYITKKQAKMVAIVTIFSSTSAAFGPSIGGFLVAGWNWPAIFIVNFPVIIIAFILAVFILPKTSKKNVELKEIDFIGILIFTISIVALIIFLLSLDNSIHWWGLIVFLLTGFLFIIYEKRKKNPFIDVEAFKRDRYITIIYAQFILINFVYFNYFFGLPTFLQQVRGYSEGHVGLIMLALPGFAVLITPVTSRLIDNFGSKIPMAMGSFLLLIGTGLLLMYNDTFLIFWLLIIMAVIGVSSGLTNTSSQMALYGHIKEEETGSASGLFQTSRYLGAIFSGSFLGLAFNNQLSDEQLHFIVIVCFVFCFIIVGLSLLLLRKMKMVQR